MFSLFKRTGFLLCIGILGILIAGKTFFAGTFKDFFPYHFYYVMTNSMEPTIPTYSLICVKNYSPSTELRKDDIITFHAVRFGEDIVITHRFSHTEVSDDGEIFYKTHPDESDVMDVYDTTRDDLLGLYQFHIPYAGKIVLFLKSRFGLLWIFEVLTILLIKEWILARWEEREQAETSPPSADPKIQMAS